MNAKFFALLLSFCVISNSVHANPSTPGPLKQEAVVAVTKINLNKADVSMLTGSFKGIGKKRAEAIIAYRDSHQGFKSIDELAEVKGLGVHFVEINHDKLSEVYTTQ